MKKTNLGDPYQKRMTLRLTENQMDYLAKMGVIMGVSPSEYLRMTINAAMISTGKAVDELITGVSVEKIMKGQGGTSNENVKTNSKHIV